MRLGQAAIAAILETRTPVEISAVPRASITQQLLFWIGWRDTSLKIPDPELLTSDERKTLANALAVRLQTGQIPIPPDKAREFAGWLNYGD